MSHLVSTSDSGGLIIDVADGSLQVVCSVFPRIHCTLFASSKISCPHALQMIQEDCVLTLKETGEQNGHISSLVPRLVYFSLGSSICR
jgi:hypothetical protein